MQTRKGGQLSVLARGYNPKIQPNTNPDQCHDDDFGPISDLLKMLDRNDKKRGVLLVAGRGK